MQGMKPDAAAIGIVNGVGKKMIEINEHGRHHYNPGLDPHIGIGLACDGCRNSKMEQDMDSCHDLIPEFCMKFDANFINALLEILTDLLKFADNGAPLVELLLSLIYKCFL